MGAEQSTAAPIKWSVLDKLWGSVALVRYAAISVALIQQIPHVVDEMLAGAMFGWWGFFSLVALLNLVLALAESAFVGIRAILAARAHEPTRGHVLLIAVLLGAGLGPCACQDVALRRHLSDRAYLDSHREVLDRAVTTGDAPSDWEIWRYDERTILRLGSWGIGDSYFLIHDPSPLPEPPERWDIGGFVGDRLDRIEHVEGPWYVLTS